MKSYGLFNAAVRGETVPLDKMQPEGQSGEQEHQDGLDDKASADRLPCQEVQQAELSDEYVADHVCL